MHRNTLPPEICPSCEILLKSAHPDLAVWFNDFVHPRHPDCHISWSWRNEQQQEALFLAGRSKAHWPESKHNIVDSEGHPHSHALDVFQLKLDNNTAIFNSDYCHQIAQETKEAGFLIDWAGNWRSFREYDHFELQHGSPDGPVTLSQERPNLA